MGQFKALLWKNYLYCKVHYYVMILIFIVPLLLGCFLFFYDFVYEDHTPNCDHETISLPSSHPAYALTSFACRKQEYCSQDIPYYKHPYDLLVNFTNLDDQATCKGVRRLFRMCAPTDADIDFADLRDADFIFRGHLLYYPVNEETNKFMESMAHMGDMAAQFKSARFKSQENMEFGPNFWISKTFSDLRDAAYCFKHLSHRFKGFKDKEEALEYSQEMLNISAAPWALLELNNTGPDFRYTIVHQMDKRDADATLVLQSLVDTAAIHHLTGHYPKYQLSIKRFPEKCYKSFGKLRGTRLAISVTVTVGFIFLLQVIASEICHERTAHLLDFLLISGVPKWKVKMAWFIFACCLASVVCVLITIVFKYFQPLIFSNTDISIILVAMLLYGLSVVFLGFLIAKYSSSSQTASITVIIFLMLCWLVPEWGHINSYAGYKGLTIIVVKILCVLYSPINIQVIFLYLIEGEVERRPVKWNNMNNSPIIGDRYGGIAQNFIFFVLTCFLYFWISIGREVFWNFVCLHIGWFKKKFMQQDDDDVEAQADFEPLLSEISVEPGIQMEKLTKLYDHETKAVNKLSATFYKNQVTIFLGHNGAGKSTTMNMLTGSILPTNGTAWIDGKSIKKNQEEIRKTLGFCPQHDVVYPHMNITEHLQFYGQLKDMKSQEVQKYIESKDYLDLSDHRPAEYLSSSKMRKLSIAIAFLGEPKTIILDEPTSGIDTVSRRSVWDFILKYRTEATILISTHYMEEADRLGDKIAIIDNGSLKCFGSPMYLKSKFGTGFLLKLLHEQPIDHAALQTELNKYVPATLNSSDENDTTYKIPLQAMRSNKMVQAIKYIEDNQDQWNIASIGLSEATMEQVFFRATSNVPASAPGTTDEGQANAPSGTALTNAELATHPFTKIDKTKKDGVALFFMQLFASFVKRFRLMWRHKLALLQFILPIILTFLIVLIALFVEDTKYDRKTKHIVPYRKARHRRSHFLTKQKGQNESLTNLFYSGSEDTFLKSLLDYGFSVNPIHKPVKFPKPLDIDYSIECGCKKCPLFDDSASPSVNLSSGHRLLNLVGQNITHYLIRADQGHYIGGIEEVQVATLSDAEMNDVPEEFRMIIQNMTARPQMHVLWTVYPDDGKKFQIPMINAYSNVLLRSQLPAGENALDYSITLYMDEEQLTKEQTKPVHKKLQYIRTTLLAIFLAFALLTPALIVVLILVSERVSKNKKLQFNMGLRKWIYWIANFLWDFSLYLVTLLLVILIMLCFPSIFTIAIEIFFFLGIIHGIAILFYVYFLSFWFKKNYNAAFFTLTFFPLLSTIPLFVNVHRGETWYGNANIVLCLSPSYFLVESIITAEINRNSQFPQPVLSWDVLGQRLLWSFISSCTLLLLIYMSEINVFKDIYDRHKGKGVKLSEDDKESKELDRNVSTEERNILESAPETLNQTNSLLAHKLIKYFKKKQKVAVAGVSFGVRKGECFGLVGTNGAGKSTLCKLLTGWYPATQGQVLVFGHDIRRQLQIARRIGYCPQDDVLFSRMTPREHLEQYGKIRGIPSQSRKEMIEHLLKELDLVNHATKRVEKLSLAVKRKLNFAICLLGFPDVIFLDEMTRSLDLEARRNAMNILSLFVHMGSSTVFISHSIEEIETLCNRLVIMVNGKFKCMDGVQQLKERHGDKFLVKLQIASTTESAEVLAKFKEIFPADVTMVEEQETYLELLLMKMEVKLSQLLQFLLDFKENGLISDYTVSQFTLEHIFVNAVKEQIYE